MRHREPETPPEAQAAEAPAGDQDGRRGGAAGFDWWAAPASRPRAVAARTEAVQPQQAQPQQAQPEQGQTQEAEPQQAEVVPGQPGPGRAGPERVARTAPEPGVAGPAAPVDTEVARGVAEGVAEPAPRAAEVYRHVQAGEEFREVRREYRRFVFPACAAFLAWYLVYIVAAVTLPGVMDRQIAGPFTVAWALGLLQFASTFLITWLYARHARDRRDRLALGLRWETQDRLR
ncbi:DUF485 domain-containing protein [Streptacidiphilus sp. N1-5]|uniref:DUF485 domain-containing protein n=1 Tax=Streptacidiphilus cavernicola TaxID=3342716 RepID=A0ABV6UWT6_9ACTN